jgi:hypothetical protein
MGEAGEAWIFYGEQQINLLPYCFELGERVSIVPISRPGKNSLDFHLVLYLSYLVARWKKGARFVVVAADADYDPVIAHAQAEGIDVVRMPELTLQVPIDGQATLEAVPPVAAKKVGRRQQQAGDTAPAKPVAPAARVPAKTSTKTASAIYAGVLKDIRGSSRPGDLKALTSRIQSRIGHEAAPEKVAAVMARLETMDVIKVVDGELIYLANASTT